MLPYGHKYAFQEKNIRIPNLTFKNTLQIN